MTVYVLEAYNTDSRYPNDVRWREYTTSKKRAELFNKIPKIQFSDSGHGIVFSAREHQGRRKERRHEMVDYVCEQMAKLNPPKTVKVSRNSQIEILKAEKSQKDLVIADLKRQLTDREQQPIKYTKLTQHLILFSKHWYGRTNNTLDDLATFMFKWSWTPKEYNTPRICYEIVAQSFVECCSKQDIYLHLKGIFDPIVRYLNKTEPMTIEECVDSMLGLMSVLPVLRQDKNGNDYDLIELPKPDPKYMLKTPIICESCQDLQYFQKTNTYCTSKCECTKYVPEVKP